MGYRLLFIFILLVCFVEIVGAKPPKKKVEKNIQLPPPPQIQPTPPNLYGYNTNVDTIKINKLKHFSDSVATVLEFCKINLETKVSNFAQVMATFPGGSDSLKSFLKQNLVFPKEALLKGYQGVVVLKFIVTNEGEICNPAIVNSVYSLIDFEALRLLKLMPNWNPAKNNGEAVNTFFNLPIKFSRY